MENNDNNNGYYCFNKMKLKTLNKIDYICDNCGHPESKHEKDEKGEFCMINFCKCKQFKKKEAEHDR